MYSIYSAPQQTEWYINILYSKNKFSLTQARVWPYSKFVQYWSNISLFFFSIFLSSINFEFIKVGVLALILPRVRSNQSIHVTICYLVFEILEQIYFTGHTVLKYWIILPKKIPREIEGKGRDETKVKINFSHSDSLNLKFLSISRETLCWKYILYTFSYVKCTILQCLCYKRYRT